MKRPRRRRSASSRASVFVSVRRRVSGSAKPAAVSAAVSVGGSGKRARSISATRGMSRAIHTVSKWSGWNVPIVRRPPGASTRAASVNAGRLDVLDDLAHEGPVEPAGLEREPLGLGQLEAAAGDVAALCDREHLGGGVDAPRTGATGGERLGDAAGAAADVEDPAAVEPAQLDERVEHRLPHGVARAQLVVALREHGERIWIRHRWDRD